MTETSSTERGTLSDSQRRWVAVLATALLFPWGVARWLDPDPRGHGTHEQLRLPPCSFVLLFGRRCPTCGMTTAWANLARCQLGAALRANVAGALLGLLALVAVPWLGLSAWRGRWLGWTPDGTMAFWVAMAVCAVALIDWVVRLSAG